MSSNTDVESAETLALQAASLDIWDQKYRLKDHSGKAVDRSILDTWKRVAASLAEIETKSGPKRQAHWQKEFLWALKNGAIPAGRIVSNAGATAFKPATSTINCTVSGAIKDSMQDILQKNLEAGLTLKAGCGIGYEFSTLRPKNAYVAGAGARTSGPLSFMDIFDKMCFTISSSGGRRGAQMATFDVHHPDVVEFIAAKRESGRLRQFNLSLLITDDFINAVHSNAQWSLSFPALAHELERDGISLNDKNRIEWRRLDHLPGDYLHNASGEIACKIYERLSARDLWNTIMRSTYDFAEPGFILIDRVNHTNNNWFCENIRATNPCGEQPLPPYGSCLLGSINLCQCVDDAFGEKALFNWQKFRKLVAIFTRMLDNVVEIHGLALEQQANEIRHKRRHGMGFLGLGSALAMLKIPYGSPASIAFTEQVSKELAIVGWKEGLALAKEKGPAPIMDEEFEVTAELLAKQPNLNHHYALGDKVSGKVLLARYSRYMQQLAEEEPELIEAIAELGCRFTHHSSIAPTGTISLSLANNASNGIEPSFAHHYSRNIIRSGKKTKEQVDVFSYELLKYRELVDANAKPYPEEGETGLPDYFVVADQIKPEQHVDVQAAAQKWIDSSISKTINVPTEISFDDFKGIYLYAHEKGLKGCTTFRYNPDAFQGVLVKQEDLENTTFVFELEDGSKVEVQGDDIVHYDGEPHTASNLYDAIKEGYYGKF